MHNASEIKILIIHYFIFLIYSFSKLRNWMNLRDADNGKVLWQSNEDL